jgi:hypothetical protein
MSLIFGIVAMSAILLVGAAVIGTQADAGPNSALMADVEGIFEAFLEPTTAVPLVLVAFLGLLTLGALIR